MKDERVSQIHPSLLREYSVLRIKDVMEILDIGKNKAYKVMRKLRAELVEKGVMEEALAAGRIPKRYFYERIFLVKPEPDERHRA